jgi:hypothetical protein
VRINLRAETTMPLFQHTCSLLLRGSAIVVLAVVASGCEEQYLNPNAASAPVSPTGQPSPAVVSIAPSSGRIGSVVTIAGINFGATMGASTVTFNGVAGTPTAWTTNSIVVPVPAGATSGSVVVTQGLPSNGVAFTVTP